MCAKIRVEGIVVHLNGLALRRSGSSSLVYFHRARKSLNHYTSQTGMQVVLKSGDRRDRPLESNIP